MLHNELKEYLNGQNRFGYIDKNSKEYKEVQIRRERSLSIVNEEEEIAAIGINHKKGGLIGNQRKNILNNSDHQDKMVHNNGHSQVDLAHSSSHERSHQLHNSSAMELENRNIDFTFNQGTQTIKGKDKFSLNEAEDVMIVSKGKEAFQGGDSSMNKPIKEGRSMNKGRSSSSHKQEQTEKKGRN